MKKLLLLIGLSMVFLGVITGQDLKPEVYVKEHVPNKEPVPYPHTRESDVMWSKIIYRIIDLRQRINLAMYYPLQPIGNRMSLIDVILLGIDEHGLTAYDANDFLNEFKIPLTPDGIDKTMGADTIKVPITQPDGSVVYEMSVSDRRTDQVKQLMVKEKWFFDKNYSTMQVRTIGICPIRVYNRLDENGMPTEEVLKKLTFWIYFPDARDILARYEVYNRHNDAQRISYDDLFWQRRFHGTIVRESNVHNNRFINSYANGLEQMYEAERIKEWLFNVEHDLWEY